MAHQAERYWNTAAVALKGEVMIQGVKKENTGWPRHGLGSGR